MLISAAIAALAALAVQAAQAAGQSIQQWINSPAGQQLINQCIQQFGPDALRLLMKKLGIDD